MSTIGKRITSDLPEDIESRMTSIETIIAGLERKKTDLEQSISSKVLEEKQINEKIEVANTELVRVTSEYASMEKSFRDREVIIAAKESELSRYENELIQKEDKINKYLLIFDRVKNIL